MKFTHPGLRWNGVWNRFKEADSVSSEPALVRAQKRGQPVSIYASFRSQESEKWSRWAKKKSGSSKEASASSEEKVESKESARFGTAHALFMESDSGQVLADQNTFDVMLIEEGLGNLGDAYYYSKEALKSGVSVFNGSKMFADHPSEFEEQTRPERSVRDIMGHFEDVKYVESNGVGQLIGKSKVMDGEEYDWARALMRQAVEYSKKFPDKNFIGLSINAGGSANPVKIEELLESTEIPMQAKAKLKLALESGITTAKYVNEIKSAVSCDLVTQAGARGRVLA